MLIGEYTHTIDDKNRVSMPSKFRKEIGKKIIITRGLDSCLFAFSVKGWEKFSQELGDMGVANSEKRKISRHFISGAVEANVDSNGRILLVDHHREFAGLTNKIVLAGVYDRLEIWDEGKWKAYKSDVEKQADTLAESLGEKGVL